MGLESVVTLQDLREVMTPMQALNEETTRLATLGKMFPAKDQQGVSVWDLAIAALNSAQSEE